MDARRDFGLERKINNCLPVGAKLLRWDQFIEKKGYGLECPRIRFWYSYQGKILSSVISKQPGRTK